MSRKSQLIIARSALAVVAAVCALIAQQAFQQIATTGNPAFGLIGGAFALVTIFTALAALGLG